MSVPHVGLIGVGRMGAPMARRIREAGFALTLTDVVQTNLAPLVARGSTAVADAAAVAAVADICLTCVPGPDEAERVFFGSRGVLSAIRGGTVVVETSTIGVELSRRIAAACAANGAAYVDAPISGGVEGAREGTLTVMAGGDAAALERVRPVLACFADRIVHLGPAGAGHLAKLVNQMIYLGYVALFCEAASVAQSYGVDRHALIDAVRHSVGGAPLSTNWEARLDSGDRVPGFAVARVLKDLRLGADACAVAGVEAPIVRAALAAFEGAAADGYGASDMTAVYRAAK